ncbi:uncharacterized protein LOC114751845 [Neltuma alba]|uniref:uncharacterized protein LOC114751845 n=1 Tax=Neltuma alba TaxID=207710 RepID=UPI0010A52E56|nr:uncharacterized protein LOC114751845 [Prosopis alba]XP_028796367.1 uncharacterized protein LOC114751845 [Prosopis alba]
MEKLIKPSDKEFMRMAILKHEETFREQLHELHRLYRIQKMLMKNMKNGRAVDVTQREWNLKNAISLTQTTNHRKDAQKKPEIKFDLERPAEEHIAESDGDEVEIMDESEIELTLGPSSYCDRAKKVDTPLTSDSGYSLSSSSTGSSHINKTAREDSSGMRNSFVDIEERSRQERLKQPPWLFQVLSLNMTQLDT